MNAFLGKRARDKFTGFEGRITAHVEYLSGGHRYGIEVLKKDGSLEEQWFDENRIKIIGEGVDAFLVAPDQNGGPNRDAPHQ